MSGFGKIFIAVVVLGVLGGTAFGCAMVDFNNSCIELEETIKVQKENNAVIYDTMWKEVQEVAAVADHHADKVKEIAVATIQGRYGNDNGVLFKAIAENSTGTLDASLYKKVAQIIEAKRNEFQANQTSMLSKVKTYKTKLRRFPGNQYAQWLGFPSEDFKFEDYEAVTSKKTKDVFESGEENETMNPFGNK